MFAILLLVEQQRNLAGTTKPSSRFLFPVELIVKSFKTCGLSLPVDGSEDDKIHCFKKEGACPDGASRLRESLNILQEEESQINPFENITDSDVEDACGPFHLIDSDQESDEEIDV